MDTGVARQAVKAVTVYTPGSRLLKNGPQSCFLKSAVL